MKVDPEKFSKFSIECRKLVGDRDGNKYYVWIIAAPFCEMRYINDSWFRPGDSDKGFASRVNN